MNKKAKILIVEDERIIAREMRHKLESMGYDVSAIVSSGEDAVKKAEELSPDLVLMMDIVLKGEIDGVEAASQIRTRFDIPIVYATANVSDARLEDITRSEPFGCLFKPFEASELHATVKMALYKYKMEKRLKKRERMLHLITKNMNDLVFMIDLNGNVQYTGPPIKDILGYEPEERIGKSSFEIVHPEDVEHVTALFETAIATSKPGRAEYRARHADGHYVWVEAIGSLVFDDTGQAVGGILNIRDITDRRKAEKKLREGEERFRELFENMRSGVAVYEAVDDGEDFIFQNFNKGAEKIERISREDVIGKRITAAFPGVKESGIFEVFQRVWRTGKPEHFPDVMYSDERIMGWRKNYIYKLPSGDIVAIYDDVTERKKNEEQLKVSEKRFSSIFSNIPNIAVQGYDKDRKVTFWNKASEQLYGYSRGEAMNKQLEELIIPPEMKEEIISGINNWHENSVQIPSGELVLMKKDKSPVQVYSSHVMIENANGGKEMFCIDIDISDRKKAEEEIKSHQEHIKLINQILRHDITNDLVVIQSAINLYNESPEDELLEEMFSHAEKSIELINRMKELESFISSHRNLNPYKINEIIDEVIKNYPFIDFKTRGKAQIMANAYLPSVIDNIIKNAVIHGRADIITITTGKKRGMCEVRIADNGTGIPDDIKERIFEEGFVHGDIGNTGIGLHIVKKAMESYGGSVWAENNDPKGAIIVLRFRMVK